MRTTRTQTARQTNKRPLLVVAMLLFMAMAGTTQAANPVETNAIGVAMSVVNVLRNAPDMPALIEVADSWGDSVASDEEFTAGIQLQKNTQDPMPVDITIRPTTAGICLDAAGNPSGNFVMNEADEQQYTLMPPVYANIEDMVGGSMTTHVTTEWLGFVQHTGGHGTPGAVLVCTVPIEVEAISWLGTTENYLIDLTVVSRLITPLLTDLFFGVFNAVDKPAFWNGDAHVVASPSQLADTTVQLWGFDQSLAVRIEVQASFSDHGNDVHDDDYLEVLLPETDRKLATEQLKSYKSEEILLRDNAEAIPYCAEAKYYDDDRWEDDNVASGKICANLKYNRVPNPGYAPAPLPSFNVTVPEACEDLIAMDLSGNTPAKPMVYDCYGALYGEAEGVPVVGDVLGLAEYVGESARDAGSQAWETASPILDEVVDLANFLIPGVAFELDGSPFEGAYVFSP